jgi:nitrate/nitrite transporter NarK
LTSVVTLVTALGKFINGAIVDIAGARRLLVLYGLCTCLALLGLRYSTTPNQAIVSCAAIDFFSSINWSSGIVSSELFSLNH